MTLAAECFEKVLDKDGDNVESLKTLAWIYAKTDSKSKTAKAIEFLRKVQSMRWRVVVMPWMQVTKHNAQDSDAWLELAALLERASDNKHDAEVGCNAVAALSVAYVRHRWPARHISARCA